MPRKAVDQQTISCMNQSLVLNLIRQKGRITRAAIAQTLKLSPPSVSANIEKLLKKGLIQEFEADSAYSRPGRKGTLIGINRHFSHVIAISLSGPVLRIALGDTCEEVIDYQQYDAIAEQPGHLIIDAIIKGIKDILHKNHLVLSQVGAIVICTPGVIDETNGKITFAPQIVGWEELNLIKTLETHFPTRVLLINDINAIALGELMQGVGQKNKSFVYINVDMGIGAGIVIDGKLLQGARMAAGEVGYMLTAVEQLDSKPRFGHLESLISIPAIRSNIIKRLGISEKDLDIPKINALYAEHNFVVRQEIEYVAKLLAMSIVNITTVLNTPIVCLGGILGELQVELPEKITSYIQDMVPYPPRICLSEMGSTGFIPGALHLGMEKILTHTINNN